VTSLRFCLRFKLAILIGQDFSDLAWRITVRRLYEEYEELKTWSGSGGAFEEAELLKMAMIGDGGGGNGREVRRVLNASEWRLWRLRKYFCGG